MSLKGIKPSGEAEQNIGLGYFYTCDEGLGGRLRQLPEDFIVEEVSEFPPEIEGGYMTAAVVKSYNWETNRLIRALSRNLRTSRRKIMFAGTKDKRAITTQLFVFEASLARVREISIADVDFLKTYSTERGIRIGNLYGNQFKINLKELEKGQKGALDICSSVTGQIKELGGFPNYFGVQRFGAVRPITHVVGMHMIHGDLESAVRDFLCLVGELEGEDAVEARKAFAETGDIAAALRDFPNKLSFEKVLLNHLLKAPEDFAGALETLPGNLVTMFVHAYQSYIFNRILTSRMKSGLALNDPEPGDMVLKIDKHGLPDHDEWVEAKERNIPRLKELIGQQKAFISAPLFGKKSEFAKGQMGEIEARILDEEKLEQKDFILPEFRKLNLKGTRREILAPVKDLTFEAEGEDDIQFEFQLNKGCYATTLMREYMKAEDLIKY